MKIDTVNENGKIMVNLSGSMYVEEAAVLREKLIVLMESGHKQFVIKLNHVEYIDSSGLGVLVAIQKRALQIQGSVTLVGASGLVKELFELTRLNKVFTMQ
ncbi:STAS domain-containing protein [Pelosinus sp. sgz500959]|uniref:STAS domain-containing protein n=1 Tax=Pelosinus sp. sgz500959 TaxID=3242472 RepID=UPI00366CD167